MSLSRFLPFGGKPLPTLWVQNGFSAVAASEMPNEHLRLADDPLSGCNQPSTYTGMRSDRVASHYKKSRF
jgi:hypothetical protein